MLELDTITVKGFKSIASLEALPLHAINVLIGANGVLRPQEPLELREREIVLLT